MQIILQHVSCTVVMELFNHHRNVMMEIITTWMVVIVNVSSNKVLIALKIPMQITQLIILALVSMQIKLSSKKLIWKSTQMKIKSCLDLIFNQIFLFSQHRCSNKECRVLFQFYGMDIKQIHWMFLKSKMVYIKTDYLQSHSAIKNNGKMWKLVLIQPAQIYLCLL